MSDSIRALIIEDRHDDAEIIMIEMEANFSDVTWKRVETRDDFLAYLTADLDVILADYTLPQFSAPDALALLQNSGHDIPFIVVTGSISEETAVACIKQGAADYLLKDRLSRLGEAVRHAIDQRNMRRAQRKAEQELIVLGHAVETSINAVVMTDLEGSITFINRAGLDLWCISSAGVIIGSSLSDLLQSHVEEETLLQNLSRGTGIKGELQSSSRDARAMILQYTANRVVDHAGQSLCLMFTFIDVTEQKKAELLHMELERERELREIRSRFVSMLVHDFRNPLSSLQVGLSLIDKFYDRLTMEQVLEKVRIALQQSSHINQLIDDVLIIGKIDYVSTEFNPEDVNLIEFCQAVFDDFKEAHDSPLHQLQFISQVKTLNYSVDRFLLRRALINLLSNAIKYSPQGGSVELTISLENALPVISVSDHGIGIPAADQKRLFEGFQRASNVGTIQGTGLGLAIVKQVVELHRGTITCISQLNQGTTFIIAFPQT